MKQKTILLVEDEALIAMMEKKDLENEGYKVIHVFTGEQSIEIVSQKKELIDLILMDIDLGNGMDGTIAAQEILKIFDIPIVFLSSHTEKEIVEKTEKITSYGYVVKSSSFTVLNTSIKMAFKLFEAKKEVIENRNQFEVIINGIPDMIGIIDDDYNVIRYNKSFYKLIGKNHNDVAGKKCYSLMGRDSPCEYCAVNLSYKSGKPEKVERYDNRLGIYIELRSYPVYDSNGKIIKIIEHFRDITELKKANEILQRKNEELLYSERKLLNEQENLKNNFENFKKLNSYLTDLLNLQDLESIYNFILDYLSQQLNDTILLYLKIYEKEFKWEVFNVSGIKNELLKKMFDIPGYNLIGKKFDLKKLHYDFFKTGRFIEFKNGFIDFCPHEFPIEILESIKKLVGLYKFYLIGINKENNLLGAIYFFSLNNEIIENIDFIETFITNAGIIIQKKMTEDKTVMLLKEKEIIFKEVHHRIKNNLNNINSILNFYKETINNREAIEIINNTITKISSLSVLYDKLYRTQTYTEGSIKEYLDEFISLIMSVFNVNIKLSLEKNIEEFSIPCNLLFPIGIIINELLTNIIKYAFSDRENGIIKISAIKKDNKVTITVEDNGVGIPDSINFDNSSGFGLNLVNMLVQQIKGTINLIRNRGTKFVITFFT